MQVRKPQRPKQQAESLGDVRGLSSIAEYVSRRGWLSLVLVLVWGMLVAGSLEASDVILKNGLALRFEGKPTPLQGLTYEQIRQGTPGPVDAYPFTMFDAVSRRYYVSQAQIEEIQLDNQFVDEFKLPVKTQGRTKMFGSIGGFMNADPFSEFGRRIVTLQGPREPIDVVQSISRIRPHYIELTALNMEWQYSVATQTLPPDVVRQTLTHAINEQNHEDRLAVARLFIDAEFYREAQIELDRIADDFPDLAARVEQLQLQVRQLQALQFANEFDRRLQAGQYNLVYEMTSRFPREDVNQATLQRIDRIRKEHDQAREQLDQVRSQLSRLQAEVRDEKLLARFQDMRSLVDQRLSRATLERLTPFLQSLDDPKMSAESKLALAYTGWVAGPSLAETESDAARNFWDARDLLLEILRTANNIRRTELIQQLKILEDVGPDVVASIIRHLEPEFETPIKGMGVPATLETLAESNREAYDILLPAEYSPYRRYPVVLALAPGGISPRQALLWWGGDSLGGPAHRQGYIVIAPHLQGGQPAAEGETESETVGNVPSASINETLAGRVMNVLRDARKRFGVDSDRVFLVGHGQGGDAVFEIGMAHADQFAGAVIITGRTSDITKHYWPNSRHLPFYVVVGELDGDNFKQVADDLTRMMKNRFDVLLAEYKQRGREDYYEELPQILEWMRLHERAPQPTAMEFKTLRPTDNRFYWLEFSGVPESLTQPRLSRSGQPIPPRPLPITAKITTGNTLYLTLGTERITLWLSPEVVDFENKLKVQWKGRTVFNQFPERDLGTMLEHLRITGDRNRLYWQKISL